MFQYPEANLAKSDKHEFPNRRIPGIAESTRWSKKRLPLTYARSGSFDEELDDAWYVARIHLTVRIDLDDDVSVDFERLFDPRLRRGAESAVLFSLDHNDRRIAAERL